MTKATMRRCLLAFVGVGLRDLVVCLPDAAQLLRLCRRKART